MHLCSPGPCTSLWRYHGDDAALLFANPPVLGSQHLSAAAVNFKKCPQADWPGHTRGNSEAADAFIFKQLYAVFILCWVLNTIWNDTFLREVGLMREPVMMSKTVQSSRVKHLFGFFSTFLSEAFQREAGVSSKPETRDVNVKSFFQVKEAFAELLCPARR